MTVSSKCALFMVFLSGIGYSIQSLFVKLMAEHGFHGTFQLIFVRGIVQMITTAVMMLDSCLTARRSNSHDAHLGVFGDSKKTALLLWARGILGYGGIAFAFLSIQYIPIADSITLFMLSPFYAAFLSCVFLGEPWLMAEYVGAILSIIGVTLITRPPVIFHYLSLDDGSANLSHGEHNRVHFGLLCAILSGLCAGCSYCVIRILGTSARVPWANIAFSQGLVQALFAFPSMYFSGQKFCLDLGMGMWGFIFLTTVLGMCSQFCMTIGMQHEKSARATLMRMSDVIGAFTWQILFTHDKVNRYSASGAVLISLGVLVVVIFKSNVSLTDDEEGSAISQLMKKVEMQVAAESAKSQKYKQLQRNEEDVEDDLEIGDTTIDVGIEEDDDLEELCMTDGELNLLEKLEHNLTES